MGRNNLNNDMKFVDRKGMFALVFTFLMVIFGLFATVDQFVNSGRTGRQSDMRTEMESEALDSLSERLNRIEQLTERSEVMEYLDSILKAKGIE